VSGIEVRPNVNSNNVEVVRTRPAYHGYLWLDPADGTVYRVTMEADMKGLPFRRAAILVEYGPVEIAGARFVCPLRSLAISEAQATAEMISGSGVTAWLNETLFTDYHHFGSSSRIVSEAASAKAPDLPGPGLPASASGGETVRQATEPAAPTQTSDQPLPAFDGKNPAAGAPDSSVTAEGPRPDTRESGKPAADAGSIDGSPATGKTPDIPTSAAGTDGSGFALRMEVNSLLVPAVVLDKVGRPVGGLSKEDFVVLDDGKRRTITGFTRVKRTRDTGGHTQASIGEGATPEPDEASAHAAPSAAKQSRFLIFLFDDRHMTTAELPLVQMAASRLLEKPLPENDFAAVLSFMGTNSGITHDHAALQTAIAKLSVHHSLQHDREDCPEVDYYSADQIIHQHNALEFQIAVEKAKQCSSLQMELRPEDPYNGMSNPLDPFQRAAMAAAAQALAMGDEDARESLASVRNVVQAMSKLSGERVLILVSSGFLSLSPETMKMKSDIMDLAAASGVVVNALDARGLYAGNLDASYGGTSTTGVAAGQPIQNHLASMQASENAMSELAVGTGGRFFHNNNDLLEGLEMLAAVPEDSYLLEVSLKDVKANGALHRLQVQLDKPGLDVLARKGYVAPGAGGKK
jgi:VWFA-related protein